MRLTIQLAPTMQKKIFPFSAKKVSCYFDAEFSHLGKLLNQQQAVIITDENIFRQHQKAFKAFRTIVIKAGEEFKVQSTVDYVIQQLIGLQADRKTFLVGVGGGVVTDLTGFVASIYMRGIRFGFVPTSVLAMVDAAIGGKNGIDVGPYKNLVGTIHQPEFLLYDFSLLRSLPDAEWINGFAEVIKHACIKDPVMFQELERKQLKDFRTDKAAFGKLIRRNVMIKSTVVMTDEFEKGERRLLNFGHTLGHAVENIYKLPHGHAISIGMVAACLVSEQFNAFKDTAKVTTLLSRYGLPTKAVFDAKKVFEVLKMDKKMAQGAIHFVMLNRIGSGIVKSLPIGQLEKMVYSFVRAR
jgi:shikimate kinase / 3-dehydroquinate synthase